MPDLHARVRYIPRETKLQLQHLDKSKQQSPQTTKTPPMHPSRTQYYKNVFRADIRPHPSGQKVLIIPHPPPARATACVMIITKTKIMAIVH